MSTAPTTTEGPHRWHDGTLVALTGSPEAATAPRLLVADSWLVDEGSVLALDVHRERFTDSVSRVDGAPTADEVEAFWAASVAALPRRGAWFPRVELIRAPSDDRLALQLRRRPAAERRRSVVLATADHDPRTRPLVKGPDIDALGRTVALARTRGADEAVLLSPDGHVVEGAWSSIVWWRGDALCMPSDDLPRLPGVTVRSLLTLAAVMGVDVLHERSTPAELDGFEVWSLGSLHGIRIATGWVDGPSPAEQPGRLALWRQRLDRLRRPLDI